LIFSALKIAVENNLETLQHINAYINVPVHTLQTTQLGTAVKNAQLEHTPNQSVAIVLSNVQQITMAINNNAFQTVLLDRLSIRITRHGFA
jgi:hypothetical protein